MVDRGLTMIFHATRFGSGGQSLSFAMIDRGTWSFFHDDGDGDKRRVGPHYRTKAELLADATRYGESWGF